MGSAAGPALEARREILGFLKDLTTGRLDANLQNGALEAAMDKKSCHDDMIWLGLLLGYIYMHILSYVYIYVCVYYKHIEKSSIANSSDPYLEDHSTDRNWLIAIVRKCPIRGVTTVVPCYTLNRWTNHGYMMLHGTQNLRSRTQKRKKCAIRCPQLVTSSHTPK